MNRGDSVIFEFASNYCILDSFVVYNGYCISSKWFLPTVVDIMVIWVNSHIPIHLSSLIPRMARFTLAVSCVSTSNVCMCMVLNGWCLSLIQSSQVVDTTQCLSWRRKWQPTPAFLPGKFHGQRSLVGYNPRGCKELDMTAPGHIHTHIHTAFTKFYKHALYIRKQYHSSSTDYVLSNAITDFKH